MDNLIICCSPADAEPNSELRKLVGTLGETIELMPSVWYVASSYGAGEAAEILRSVMDPATSLIVVNASSDDLAWFDLAEGDHLQQLWESVSGRTSRM